MYILICSIIGGFSVSCVKGVGVMVRQFLSGDPNYHLNIFLEPFAYILVVALLLSLTTQLNYSKVKKVVQFIVKFGWQLQLKLNFVEAV